MTASDNLSGDQFHAATNPKPAKGTIKQVAECDHCQEMLEKTAISQGWYHSHTGNRAC